MQLRKRKKIKVVPPRASAKPDGTIIKNPPKEKIDYSDREYKWKQLFSQLQPAI